MSANVNGHNLPEGWYYTVSYIKKVLIVKIWRDFIMVQWSSQVQTKFKFKEGTFKRCGRLWKRKSNEVPGKLERFWVVDGAMDEGRRKLDGGSA